MKPDERDVGGGHQILESPGEVIRVLSFAEFGEEDEIATGAPGRASPQPFFGLLLPLRSQRLHR